MASVTCGLGPCRLLAVLKMVRADSVGVVQLLCRFRANMTSPSVSTTHLLDLLNIMVLQQDRSQDFERGSSFFGIS